MRSGLTELCLAILMVGTFVENSFALANARDVLFAPDSFYKSNHALALRGRVLWRSEENFLFEDSSGSLHVMNRATDPTPEAGETVDIVCRTDFDTRRDRYLVATNICVTGRETVTEPRLVTAQEIAAGLLDYRPIRISGVIADVFQDEIDSIYIWMVVRTSTGNVIASLCHKPDAAAELESLIDAEVLITGACIPRSYGFRHFMRHHVEVSNPDAISIIKPSPTDPFLAPEAEPDLFNSFFRTLHRRTVRGTVLASWDGDQMFIATKDNHKLKTSIQSCTSLPETDSEVIVSGFIDYNSFYPTLSKALVRSLPKAMARAENPPNDETPIVPVVPNGKQSIDPSCHGKLIRVRGTVRDIKNDPVSKSNRIYIDSNGVLTPIALDNLTKSLLGLQIGCEVEVIGICLLETTEAVEGIAFSRVCGFTVIPRSAADFHQLTFAPFWTPFRMLIIISALFLALIIITIWNRTLRRLSERKGRALFKAEIEKASACLKIDERTRLAIELHDSIAQMLTGISLRLDLIGKFADQGSKTIREHVSIASKSLQSCRDELRNCIWDLRNQALDEPTIDNAIRKSVQPYLHGITLKTNFNVPRRMLCDNAAHTILKIIRELVFNAIRHGQAKNITVNGALEHRRLVFSVTDDGIGFRTDGLPGVKDGHFGLTGIRERIHHFNGEFNISSVIGTGTTANVSFAIPPLPNADAT